MEIGSLMMDTESDRPVPIIGLSIDAFGKVVPVCSSIYIFIYCS